MLLTEAPLLMELHQKLERLPQYGTVDLSVITPQLENIEAAHHSVNRSHTVRSKTGKPVPDKWLFALYSTPAWKNYKKWVASTELGKARRKGQNERYWANPQHVYEANQRRRRARKKSWDTKNLPRLARELDQSLLEEDDPELIGWLVLDQLETQYKDESRAKKVYLQLAWEVLSKRLKNGIKQPKLLKTTAQLLFKDNATQQIEKLFGGCNNDTVRM